MIGCEYIEEPMLTVKVVDILDQNKLKRKNLNQTADSFEHEIHEFGKVPKIILQKCYPGNHASSEDYQSIGISIKKEPDNAENHTREIKEEPTDTIKTESNKENVSSRKDDEISDSDESDNEEDTSISEYERMRLKNINDNARFFASLDIFQAKEQLSAINKPTTSKSTKSIPKEKVIVTLRKPSLRIRRQGPDGKPLAPKPVIRYIEEVTKREERKPIGPLEMLPTNIENNSKENSSTKLNQMMKDITNSPNTKPEKISPELEKFSQSFSKMKITPERVAKVTKERVYSVAIHPSSDKVLVCAGGKGGRLGIWDVESKNEETKGILMFEPHSSPINSLHFAPANSCRLYSSSYDGTVRCGDFEKGVFDEVYASTLGEGIYVSHFDFLTPDGSQLIVAQNDGKGHVAMVDTRIGSSAQSIHHLHNKSIRTVSVHPLKKNYIVTGSKDGTVALWDTRLLKRKKKNNNIMSLNQGRAVTAAYFSPLTGAKVLTTSYNDTIRVYKFCDNGAVFLKTNIRHNNFVGRWLTCFRAVWHPQREDMFITGSMAKPRRIEVFSDKAVLLKNFMDEENLGSVCSINAFHPTQNILVGGNSSGRLHVFM